MSYSGCCMQAHSLHRTTANTGLLSLFISSTTNVIHYPSNYR